MTELDPRRPVIIGVGQHTQRTDRGAEVLEPAALLAAATRVACADTGVRLGPVGSLRLVRSLSALAYRNGPRLVAELADCAAQEHVVVQGGGETPGAALTRACADLAAGTHDTIVLVAGEAWYSRTQAERAGAAPVLAEQPSDLAPPIEHGSMLEFVHPVERALGIVRPIQEYPLFEQALRRTLGHSLAEHAAHLGRFGERFSAVAQANPHAWDTTPHTAAEIATPSPGNRLVGFPYTKLLVSNEQVDTAAALVLTTVGHARALGVDPQRFVYPLAAANGEAHAISERMELHDSVLAREVGAQLDALTDRPCRDAAHVDLYSCFPSAVQIQAAELGLADGRPLTHTGGMRFAGGPWCGYAMHGFAAVVDALRADPGSLGLVSANGGAITKLVVTLLSTAPTAHFRAASAQLAIDAAPRRAVVAGVARGAIVESYTVMHGRGGVAQSAVLACRTPDDARAWGIVRDPAAAAEAVHTDLIGLPVHLDADGTAHL